MKNQTDGVEVLTVEEAAAFLRVDPVTVQRELRRGRLPGNQVGRSWRLSRSALRDYINGGDLTHAMLEAGGRFYQDDIDGGLRVLLRNFAADHRVPADMRSKLLLKFALLAEAEEKTDPDRAREAMFRDEPNMIEERRGTLSGLIVNMTALWNRSVEDLARALEARQRRSRGRKG